MTPESQRIAIAEACGWEKIYKGPEPDNRMLTPDGRYSSVGQLPDYLSDLNAMAEAQGRFIGNARDAMYYALVLLRVCGLPVTSEHDELNVDYCWHACNATAAQRAEAFLRTLNLWRDEA